MFFVNIMDQINKIISLFNHFDLVIFTATSGSAKLSFYVIKKDSSFFIIDYKNNHYHWYGNSSPFSLCSVPTPVNEVIWSVRNGNYVRHNYFSDDQIINFFYQMIDFLNSDKKKDNLLYTYLGVNLYFQNLID